jgi:hypothetical protein
MLRAMNPDELQRENEGDSHGDSAQSPSRPAPNLLLARTAFWWGITMMIAALFIPGAGKASFIIMGLSFCGGLFIPRWYYRLGSVPLIALCIYAMFVADQYVVLHDLRVPDRIKPEDVAARIAAANFVPVPNTSFSSLLPQAIQYHQKREISDVQAYRQLPASPNGTLLLGYRLGDSHIFLYSAPGAKGNGKRLEEEATAIRGALQEGWFGVFPEPSAPPAK